MKLVFVRGIKSLTLTARRPKFGKTSGKVSRQARERISVTVDRLGESQSFSLVPESVDEMNPFGEMEPRGKVGISLSYVKPLIAVVDPSSPAPKQDSRVVTSLYR